MATFEIILFSGMLAGCGYIIGSITGYNQGQSDIKEIYDIK